MKNFELWPAIDLLNSKPVRLLQGDFDKKTEFTIDFKNIVDAFNKFASGIHIVDLDGAKLGKPTNIEAIKEIIKYAKIPVEIGGGIRTQNDAQVLFDIGASRVILGTKAVEDLEFLRKFICKFGKDKVVVGVDVKNNLVATHGWQETSNVQVDEFLGTLTRMEIQNVIFTDIAHDGTLSGPPIKLFKFIVQQFPKLRLIASGGISNIKDIEKLKETGVAGVIFGRAFYDDKITEKELMDFIKRNA